jgi:hypothetical protein
MSGNLTFGDVLLSIHKTFVSDLYNPRLRDTGKWSLTGIVQLSDRSAGEKVNTHSFKVGRAYRSEKAAREAAEKRFSNIEWSAESDHGVTHGRVWASANPEAVAYAESVIASRAASQAAFAARVEKARASA